MKQEICANVGSQMSDEVEKMLNMFSSNAESIEKNFLALRKQISEVQTNVIGEIKH